MKVILRNSILLLFLTIVTYGCDTGPKPVSKIPVAKKPESKTPPIHKSELPPGESLNRTTEGFRNTTITMGTDLNLLRLQGEWVFTTPFNKHDGLGDGPINPNNKIQPGGRLTLPAFPSIDDKPAEGNKFFLRINGLDSQTCVECHFIVNILHTALTFDILD